MDCPHLAGQVPASLGLTRILQVMYIPGIMNDATNPVSLGIEVARRRKEAGLTQSELAKAMGTTQPAISKIESGRTLPTLPFLDRLAVATGKPLTLVLGEDPVLTSEDRAQRVRRVLGGYQFNPWDRSPTEAEAKSLLADGLTRERFEGAQAAG
jgi:transcriptional regulator with XRE-family HTH domain